MNDKSFVFYESAYKQFEILKERKPEIALKWIDAIFRYGLYDEIPDTNDDIMLYGFEQTITAISKAKERYSASVKNGKKGGRPEQFNKDDIIALKEQGLTQKKIAEELGCSERTVSRKLKEIKPDKTEFCPTKQTAAISMYDKSNKTRQNLNDNVNVNDNKKLNDDELLKIGIDYDALAAATTPEERYKAIGF